MRHYTVDFAFIPRRFKKKFNRHCVCSFQFDIAVIKTVEIIPVRSLDRLPAVNREPLKAFHRTQLYGWGRTEDGTYADHMRRAKLLIVSTIPNWPTQREQLLFSYNTTSAGAVGDSGGPWMSLDNTRIYGIHVGQTNPYGVAIKISYYANWIFYVMYEYRDLLPETLPRDRIIRCCGHFNATVYHTRTNR